MAGEGVDMKIKQLPGDTLDLVQASLQRIEDAVGKQVSMQVHRGVSVFFVSDAFRRCG